MSTQKEIIEKYPLLFKNLRSGKEKFECGKGWNNIIEEACENIMDYFDKFPEHSQNNIDSFVVVKEKYGFLTIQGGTFPDIVYDLIKDAEVKSFCTCEYCGDKGRPITIWGWEKTLCESCEKEDSRV